MDRRDFLRQGGTAAWAALAGGEQALAGLLQEGPPPLEISWRRSRATGLFEGLCAAQHSLVDPAEGAGILDGFCRMIGDREGAPEHQIGEDRAEGRCGKVGMVLGHRLLSSRGTSRKDLLEATLELRNDSPRACEVLAGFLSGVRPCTRAGDQRLYLPISAQALARDPARGDCRQALAPGGYLAHYLEPRASDPRGAAGQAILLAPVVDVHAEGGPCHVALFSSSLEAVFFQALEGPSRRAWRIGRRLRLEPGASQKLQAYLLIHDGDAAVAWRAYHRFAHKEDFAPPEWTRAFRVHYYDFLSAARAGGHRGGGYEADLKHFRAFRVGMATQHGYYLALGDYLHPDRERWPAMAGDSQGPAEMSLHKMRARIEATRRAGAHPMVYLHLTLFDEGSPRYEELKDSIQLDAQGKPIPFGWRGPDVIAKTWKMSVASATWREHLLKQAGWIMELLDPDGIVVDETFTAFGFDHHPDRRGPLSSAGIELMRRLRALLRSFGADKALFASDCSMGSYCQWSDGEAGDHCYERLLGQPLYRMPPVRYLAALGTKAWRPCAWRFRSLWNAQMDLARKTGAGVGVSNGWGDDLGLSRLPAGDRRRMLDQIATLRP